MTPRPVNRQSGGFTLVELLVSTSLMALILSSAYVCLHAAFSAQKLIEPRVDVVQSARVALALMTADLRGACALSKETPLVGLHRMLGKIEADNLDFATHHHTPRRPAEGDYCQVSYFLRRDRESDQVVLWRRRNPVIGLEPLIGGQRQEIARGLQQLRFEYYDGFDWYDTWGDPEGENKDTTSLQTRAILSGMPEAIRITLGFDVDTKTRAATRSVPGTNSLPMVFQTVVRLNLAALQDSSPGASSATSTPSTPDAGTPSPANPNPGSR